MSNDHSIIYVMRHIDIGGNIDIPYKKVGITGAGNATLTSRLQQISNTKSPIKAQYVAAWKHDNAQALEKALHSLLENTRIEGEWFLDKEGNLVERMQPIMDLLGATVINIKQTDDDYTKSVIQKELEAKEKSDHILLGEISEYLKFPLRSTSRKGGPTFYSDKKELTYYVGARKSGNHNLSIGRSKGIYNELSTFIAEQGYDVEQAPKGNTRVMGINSTSIANIINSIEGSFNPS
jgi:hypothetical protein